jgi:hypothetical protein
MLVPTGEGNKKMDIALPEIIATLHFYELQPGEFFRFYRAGKEGFGLCVSDGRNSRDAVLFAGDSPLPLPALVMGGLPDDKITHFPKAVLRADLASASDIDPRSVNGTIISDGATSYIRANQRDGNYCTFDLATGLAKHHKGAAIYFSRWYVTLTTDKNVETIFSFPP